MMKIVIGVLLIGILLIKIYEVGLKYNESFKNIFNFKCVVVSTDKLRKKGLMNRKKKLKDGQGMLFDFKEPMMISLWISLDENTSLGSVLNNVSCSEDLYSK